MSSFELRSRWATTVALLGAGAIAGIVGATAFNASAVTTSGSPAAAVSSPGASGSSSAPPAAGGTGHYGDRDGDGPHGGPGNGHNPDEKSVPSAQAAKLKAAALKQVPGGTVVRVETDSGDAAYEVHMTDKNGNPVIAKFDKDLDFVAVEDGRGT